MIWNSGHVRWGIWYKVYSSHFQKQRILQLNLPGGSKYHNISFESDPGCRCRMILLKALLHWVRAIDLHVVETKKSKHWPFVPPNALSSSIGFAASAVLSKFRCRTVRCEEFHARFAAGQMIVSYHCKGPKDSCIQRYTFIYHQTLILASLLVLR